MSSAQTGRRRKRLGISTKATEKDVPPTTAEDTDGPAVGGPGAAESAGTSGPPWTEPAASAGPPEPQGQDEDLLSNFGGGLPAVVDPFAPQLVDRAQLPETPEERLAVYEAAIETSRGTLADTVTRARFRAEIEIGFVLDAIRSEPELYVPNYGTIENYGEARWGYKRSTMYELMDTAPIRLAAASGRVVSGNPDTMGRMALATPAPRLALEAAPVDPSTEDAPEAAEKAAADATPPRPVQVELSKSVALELVQVWRARGEDAALAMLAEADQKAQKHGRKITAALVRQVVKDWGAAQDQGNTGKLPPSEKERREKVNTTLANAATAIDKAITALGKLDMESVPPLDHATAERHAKAIRAAGRWLTNHVRVPEEVVDAEFVQD